MPKLRGMRRRDFKRLRPGDSVYKFSPYNPGDVTEYTLFSNDNKKKIFRCESKFLNILETQFLSRANCIGFFISESFIKDRIRPP